MSNVWETRYRLLVEQVEALAVQLRAEEPIDPSALEAQTVRLLAGVMTLQATPRQQTRPVQLLWMDETGMAAVAQTAAMHGVPKY